jgi:hypothetical protein
MGFEDEAEQSIGRPYRQTNGGSKRPSELTSSIVPRGTSCHHAVELEFPLITFDPARFFAARDVGRAPSLLAGGAQQETTTNNPTVPLQQQ